MGDKLRTLSDAIILGSTFRRQSFQDICDRGRTCAIGAAAEAIGLDVIKFHIEPDGYAIQEALEKRFCGMEIIRVCCPNEGCIWTNREQSVHDAVVHLNDDHHWKRERIAAWLKTKGL